MLPLTLEYPEGLFNLEKFVECDIFVTLDSGCCEHVLDLMDAPGYETQLCPSAGSLRGQHFVVENGERIPNEGQVELMMEAKDGTPRGLRSIFQVAEVMRPLMSASRIADEGYKCLFGDKDAKVLDKDWNVICTFVREGSLYVATLRLKRPAADDASAQGPAAPFARQEP